MKFLRGLNPEEAMSIGISGKVKDWFDENNTAEANHIIRKNGNIITVQVQGSLVLEKFDSTGNEAIKDNYRVEIGEVSGTCTILSLLDLQRIYEKIKSFYTRVLNNCTGKSSDEQYQYLFGKDWENLDPGEFNHVRRFKEEIIENSQELIRGLPDVPSDHELLNIANEILSGKLEYAFHALDDYSVKMSQYANEIYKRFNCLEYD